MTIDEKYIYRCLQLARLGAGNVAPNPMVGAVLVYENKIIGEGFHEQYGCAHAEVNCINSVLVEKQLQIDKSTLYVSLEPCSHFGKTPPCADLIIKNKIPKVVVGCKDNFLEVNGRGIEKLQAAGVEVIVGVLEKEATDLNKRFFTFHQQQRPYIILKWAQTANGKIAGSDDKRVFISNGITNRLVHQWRSEEAAIMVGTNTALKDNPVLNARLAAGNNPVRVVIDMNNKLPGSLQLLDGTIKTIVFNSLKDETGAILSFYKINKTEKVIPQVLKVLYQLKIQSLLVEGGATLLQSFIDENIWDEARVITNNTLTIDNGLSAPILLNEQLTSTANLLNDSIAYFTNHNK